MIEENENPEAKKKTKIFLCGFWGCEGGEWYEEGEWLFMLSCE